MTTQPFESNLQQLGFGPGRSAAMAAKASESVLNKIVQFSEQARGRGFQFRVFQSSGRNTHYTRLRLMLVTGKKPNRYEDSRGFDGPMEEIEVSARGITHAQIAAIVHVIDEFGQLVRASA